MEEATEIRIHLLRYLPVIGSLIVILAMPGAEFFGPCSPSSGWGIGVAANAWDVYSRDVPTEAEIRREMDRLRTSS